MKIRVFNNSWFGTWVMNRGTLMIKRMIFRLIAPNTKNLFYVFGFGHLMDMSEKLKKSF